MAKACHPVHAQLWLRPPSLELVKLTARPPPLVEQGKRRPSLDRWYVQQQREHNCKFLIPRHLAGQDDTWPVELRDWPNKVTKWNSNKADIAQNLLKWYPEEPGLVNAAAWLQETHRRYPEAFWYHESLLGWPAILLISAATFGLWLALMLATMTDLLNR